MKSTKSSILLLFITVFSYAQEDLPDNYNVKPVIRNGYNGFVMNAHITTLDEINSILSNNEFPEFNELGTQFQWKLQRTTGRPWASFVVLNYHRRESNISAVSSNSIKLNGWGLGVGGEHLTVDRKHFFIKPYAVLNLMYYQFTFLENADSDSLDGILNSDTKTFRLGSFQLPIDGGLNIGTRFQAGGMPLTIFFGAGYRLHYDNESWRLNRNLNLDDNINLSSPYFTFGIGFTT